MIDGYRILTKSDHCAAGQILPGATRDDAISLARHDTLVDGESREVWEMYGDNSERLVATTSGINGSRNQEGTEYSYD